MNDAWETTENDECYIYNMNKIKIEASKPILVQYK